MSMHVGKGTTYSIPIGNNGFCNVFVFHSVAKDIFVYSWAEIVPRDEVVLYRITT